MRFICFSRIGKKKDIGRIIYPGLRVFCCVRIIVKNSILNKLTDYSTRMYGGGGGNCVAYIKKEKESMNIVIALQDSLEALT